MTPQLKPMDFSAARQLADLRGQQYWRSLEELAQSREFQELVEREFSGPSGGWTDPVNRRQFLVLAAASLGLAGLTGCSPAPPERIVPYVRTPEGVTPGQRQYYATAMPQAGDALGLLVESHEGRPTKIEGNPEHSGSPSSQERARFGPTDIFAQASLLTLYDPDRSAAIMHHGNIGTWDAFVAELRRALGSRGERTRVRILTDTVTSPSLADQLRRLPERIPLAKWHVHEPVDRDNIVRGARLAFGENVEAHYRLDRADVIVAFEADFLSQGPGHVRHLHDFASRRRVRQGRTETMNRLYVVENTPSSTGAIADHRLPRRAQEIEALARGLAKRLISTAVPDENDADAAWLDAVARDLRQHRGASLILAGPGQPPGVHALAHALNDELGNVGRTVVYTRPVVIEAPGGGLRELVDDMNAGAVDVLIVLGANPAYTAPADLQVAAALGRVPFRVHLGLYADETSALCHWHLPEAHFLESWGDARSHDGTVSIIQPLIAPLHAGRTATEVLALLLGESGPSSYDITRSYWRALFGPASSDARAIRADWQRDGLLSAFTGDFESWWRKTVHDGMAAGTQLPAKSVTLRANGLEHAAPQPTNGDDLEINFHPDPTIGDGRFANNGWLQELPKPFSKLTWNNAVYLSPATAVRLGFAPAEHPEQANEKVVTMTHRGRTEEGPLWVLPGHADNSITVHLGYGRTRAGRVGTGLGFDAYRLRTSGARHFDHGVQLRLSGRRDSLACTQHHHLMENRDLVRSGTVQQPPAMPQRRRLTLYDEAEHPYTGDQWGMVIDLNVCTGCSACMVACQAENNIPVVGKEQVRRGREMHWIRVDRYFAGDAAHPSMFFQPVPCMHCENAPCEVVCPVGATVHSSDGLNDMVYNRCVGTRYCSNNCPYKVRRFNFLQFADFTTENYRLMRNPEVTVRSRGVMEKCTYCVQRIRAGQIKAQVEDRSILDGDVVTACQAVCPAGAIIFGNLNDKDAQGRPRSEVAKLQSEPLHYSLLEELNTRPRTTYLAALKNPNPEIARLENR